MFQSMTIKLLSSAGCFGACLALAAQAPVQPQQDSEAALDTINLINHINYSVEVIRTYNNVIALEEEYQKISVDNLNLNRIRDEEALQLIRDISGVLNSMRMNERARKWYQHILTRDLKGAKLDGMSKIANTAMESVVNGSGGIISRLISTAQATAVEATSSFFDYKKAEHALQGQLEDKQFELDTEKLNKLHDMNDMLLERQWKLVNSYKLDDRLRVTANQVKSLVKCLKDPNRVRCFRRIKPMATGFEVYPTYWYYRAAMAIAADDYEDALDSCKHFEKVNRGLFRSDRMAANIAMIKVTAMLQSNHLDKDAIRKSLKDIRERNADSTDSAQAIFCVSIYLSVLDDPNEALKVLDPLMARLDAESEDELVDYCDLFNRPNTRQTSPPNTVDLVQCRMLRLAIDHKKEQKIHVERLKSICERETTCCLEKLFYFGQLRIEDLWELARKDVIKINLEKVDGNLTLEVPVQWFLLGNMDISVELLSGTNVIASLDCDEPKRTHVMSHPHLLPNSQEMAYVKVNQLIRSGSLEKFDHARLRLKHISWPVDILYVVPMQDMSETNVPLIPLRVERFMAREVNKEVMPPPNDRPNNKSETPEAENVESADTHVHETIQPNDVVSSLKLAQMYLDEQRYDDAAKIYDGLLVRQQIEGNIWCAYAVKQVGLLLRLASEVTDPQQAKKRADYLARAEKYTGDLLRKYESLQSCYAKARCFGKTVTFKARILMLRGKPKEAQSLVTEYLPQLAELHKTLLEQNPGRCDTSPLPECRYLLASDLWKAVQDEAKKPKPDEDMIKDSLFGAREGGKRNGLGAYNHAINVFMKDPESKWATDAKALADDIEKFVKARYNKEIKVKQR